jgi:hypothetical protein
MENFTQQQRERIFEFLSNLNDCNYKANSNCKVKAINMYEDNRGNFVCTYILQTFGGQDGVQNDIKYAQIDSLGNKSNMLDSYSSGSAIEAAMVGMKKIEI